jgi:CRP-like cAMP-binding protein
MWERFVLWLRENASTLVLNFGSICTLFGFTRSDVLELRALSVTGSICGMFYHFTLRPLRYPPLFWSALFAFVNGYKILEIVQERQGNVRLTQQQEQRYIHFFMPHGITPKQFEIIDAKAESLDYKKGQIIIRRDEELNHVYLVVQGTTRASILGRFLTAASFRHNTEPERAGQTITNTSSSSSGAWIGEISLLERVWLKEQGKLNVKTSTPPPPPQQQPSSTKQSDANDETSNHKDTTTAATITRKDSPPRPQQTNHRSMYTIVAQDDCTVLRWSHADMEQLMEKSSDMRAGLTRAMTAAIVGKVINFTVSRQNAAKLPTWSTWLDDWKSSGAQVVQVQVENNNNNPTTTSNPTTAEETITTPKENLPLYPIRRFR